MVLYTKYGYVTYPFHSWYLLYNLKKLFIRRSTVFPCTAEEHFLPFLSPSFHELPLTNPLHFPSPNPTPCHSSIINSAVAYNIVFQTYSQFRRIISQTPVSTFRQSSVWNIRTGLGNGNCKFIWRHFKTDSSERVGNLGKVKFPTSSFNVILLPEV